MSPLSLIFILSAAVIVALIGWRWWRRYQTLRQREQVEDALKHVHACEWRNGRATLESLCGALHLSANRAVRLLTQMENDGLLRTSTDGLRLTPEGERMALAIIRAHRLLERYLADEARMPLANVHTEAERREHDLTPAAVDAMEAALGYPMIDPHGDPIPAKDGTITAVAQQALLQLAIGCSATITRVSDRNSAMLRYAAELGLRPGVRVTLIGAEPFGGSLRLKIGRAECTIGRELAAQVFVTINE